MSKLTTAQVEEIATLREQGWSYKRLAARYAVTAGAIHYRCLREGLCRLGHKVLRPAARRGVAFGFGGKVRHFTVAEDEQLLSLARAGARIDAIAATINRPRTSVRIRLLTLELKGEAA